MKKLKANENEIFIPGITILDSVIRRFTEINKLLCDYIANETFDHCVNEVNIKDIIERNNQSIIVLKIQKSDLKRSKK